MKNHFTATYVADALYKRIRLSDCLQTRLVSLEKQGSSVPRGIMNEIKMNFTVPKIDDNKDNSAFEEIQFVGIEEREKVEEIVAK